MPSFTPSAAAGAVQRLLLVLGLATLAGVLVAGLVLPLVGSIGLAARTSAQSFRDLPAELQSRPLAQRSVVLDANGKTIATFYDEYRIYRSLTTIPKVMQRALIDTEDARFYEHGPIDTPGVGRALLDNFKNGGSPLSGQGASTLTQQYVKLLLIDQAQTKAEVAAATAATPARKLRELRLAIAAEERWSKDQILERYLNIAYFGGGAYGVEAAARHYFHKSAQDLDLREAALLAGLVQSPSRYDPAKDPRLAKIRRNAVLTRMETVGDITPYRAAKTRKLGLGLDIRTIDNGCITSYAPFFCDYVRQSIRAMPSLGPTPNARERVLMRGGLIVRTTLDPKMQAAAKKSVQSYVFPTDETAAAIAMVEPGTGKIKAMTQSKEYGSGSGKTFINLAVDKDRGYGNGFQPGSTFKVFVLAAAIQQGIPLSTTINSPDQLDATNLRFRTCDGSVRDTTWRPKSSTGSGLLDIPKGTAYSNNTFYVQLEQRTGLCSPARIAEKLGVTNADGTPLAQYPTFTLGVAYVSPLTMAEAYATFAAHGEHCTSVAVTSIVSRTGRRFDVPGADCKQVIDRNVADTVTSVLAGVIDGPYPGRTGQRQHIDGRDAAGKTGTTDLTASVWFVGYTPQLAAAVGIGDPMGTRKLYNRRIGGKFLGFEQVCGGCLPGPIWHDAMVGALEGQPSIPFDTPKPYGDQTQQAAGVPDVRGLDIGAAGVAIAQAGYRWRVVGQVTSPQPAGTVVDTNPLPGTALPPGSEIQLSTSNGLG